MAAVALTGAAFGAALTASGVYLPPVILGQLRWENYHMLQAFLTATAASTLIAAAANARGYAVFAPRRYADRGWFAPYDGNVVGGLALGVGMALSGACPGTVLVQTALGIRTGLYALAGGLAGGAVWSAVLRPRVGKAAPAAAPTTAANPPTAAAFLGVSPLTAVAIFEAVLAAAVGVAAAFGPGPDAVLSPVLGGLLIGLVQLFSVVVRKSMLGVSTVYEDFGDWLLWSSSNKNNNKKPGVNSIIFALGIAAGARVTAALFPAVVGPAAAAAVRPAVTPATAALGGFIMAVGSRVAGGCTSGHGISGMALLSLPSFLTMGMAFVGGGIVALLL